MSGRAARPPSPEGPHNRGLLSKRQAILAAALELFVQRGYAATTLDDVATAAPASRQTVYNHFGDKETLFRAVIDAHLAAAIEVLDEVTLSFPEPPSDPEAYLNELAKRTTAIFRDPRTASLRLLLQSEGARQPQLVELWRRRVAGPIWSALLSHLSRLTSGGLLQIDEPDRATGQFLALTVGTVWQVSELGAHSATASPANQSDEFDDALRSSVALFVRGYQPREHRPSDGVARLPDS